MAPIRAFLLAGVLLAGGAAASAGPGPIVLDGHFDDWKGVPTTMKDPVDARDAEVDVRELRVTHDAENVYLALEMERAVNLHALRGTLELLLDVDGNPSTGRMDSGLPGVDLVVEFSPVGAQNRPAPGARLRTPRGATQWTTHNIYEAGLAFAPSFAARRVEIALRRGPASGLALFRAERWRGKLVFRGEAGEVLDQTPAFHEVLSDATAAEALPPRDPRTDPLARAPGTDLRVLSWNVNRSQFLKRPDVFARILAAVRPDLLILDELPPDTDGARLAAFLTTTLSAPASPFTPGAADAETCAVEVPCAPAWNTVFGACGGTQRVAVAARSTLAPVGSLRWVDYPEPPLRELERAQGMGSRESADALLAQGVGTGGARLQVDGRSLLAASVDLQCCGRAAGPEDTLRVLEASAVRDALRKALGAEKSDAVILAGDFNLVGSRVPLDLASRNLDPDGDHLEVVEALQLDGRSNATWMDPGGPFGPGRLDFMLFSASSLRVQRAFVFDSADLGPDWRARHGVQEGDSPAASDHCPVVADFRWRRAGGDR